ncbi:RNA-guided endonuclease InsQ/TnpB family protein [Alkalihalobacterium alkalinitrilicum]|uniref:RNA-guided endonuclease InsQ/TnpB family protein n=1 Tax=Alkalihalobacterium alkalinitrilicum TaxID=427920 RepID=UPI000995C557|nr:RNA-guided endonuclease TnpB family protein [Alkalihalobacterium alkalinitrilicum]
MKKAFKTEIRLTDEQQTKIHQTIGVCRFLYNRFLAYNRDHYEQYKQGKLEYGYVSGMDFDKYVNNDLSKQEGFKWIKQVGSKAGRYYVSVLCEVEVSTKEEQLTQEGVGIDLGIKTFAVCSNDATFPNINKTVHVRKLEKKLRREQRSLSRKYEFFYKETKTKGGEPATKRTNLQKNLLRVQRFHQRLAKIRQEYVKSVVNQVVKTKLSFITIEYLNIKGMMKNKHLSKAIAKQCFYEFTKWLEAKCRENGIELRQVGRFYPSSKTCSQCGQVKKDLRLKDRVFTCSCGHRTDRDKNASLNLVQAKEYTILT